MSATTILILCCLILAVAVLYSAVGQAGATGYLAAMALVGLAPEVMKPSALVLNLLVAAFATYRLHGNRLIDWRASAPLLIASVPVAFIGGAIQLPEMWFRHLVGAILLVAALIVLFGAGLQNADSDRAPARLPVLPAVVSGLTIGLLSGLTGTGGGIFLSPLLLVLGWANARSAAGVTLPFNCSIQPRLSPGMFWRCERCRPSCRTSSLPQSPVQASALRWALHGCRSARFSACWRSYSWPQA